MVFPSSVDPGVSRDTLCYLHANERLDAEILTSHYGQAGLDATFSKALSGKRLGGTSLVVRAGASYLMATAGRKRLACDLSLGLLF